MRCLYVHSSHCERLCLVVWKTHSSHYSLEGFSDSRFVYVTGLRSGGPTECDSTPNYCKKQLNLTYDAPIDYKLQQTNCPCAKFTVKNIDQRQPSVKVRVIYNT
jgi:hypothetical protein